MRKKILILGVALIQLSATFATVPVLDTKKDSASAYVSKEDEAMVKNAIASFKSLSKEERKARIADAKHLFKEYKTNKAEKTAEASTNTILLAILAILLPPLAVYLHEDAINTKFWISLLLSLLFWLPGIIYALIVIFG